MCCIFDFLEQLLLLLPQMILLQNPTALIPIAVSFFLRFRLLLGTGVAVASLGTSVPCEADVSGRLDGVIVKLVSNAVAERAMDSERRNKRAASPDCAGKSVDFRADVNSPAQIGYKQLFLGVQE